MKRLILVDLDDTLFQTRRKNPGATRVAALDAAGAPRSFQSDSQAALWAWLHEGARVIPVTGRAVSALRRVRLPLGPEAVCSFGGVILGPDGTPDPAWHAALAPAAAEHAPRLEALAAELPPLAAQHNAKMRHKLVWDAGLPLYVTWRMEEDGAPPPETLVQAFRARLPPDWTCHVSPTTVAALPPFLDKRHAVAHLLAGLPEPHLTIGVGDALTDVGFLALCDMAMMPKDSQVLAFLRAALARGTP